MAAEECLVLHAERDLVQIRVVEIVLLQVLQHFLGTAELGEVGPGRAVDAAELLDRLQGHGRRVGHHLLVLRHLHRVVQELARRREVEMVLQRLGAIRFQIEVHAAGLAALEDGHRAARNLQQDIQFLLRGRRVRDDDLATVHRVHQELVRDELVDLFVVHLLVAVAVTEEVLAHQDRRLFLGGGNLLDLFVEHVQLGIAPGLSVGRQVIRQQPMIEELLVAFVLQVGAMSVRKNSGSLWYRKKCNSWQAYFEYRSRFSSGFRFGQFLKNPNSISCGLLLSVA